MKKAKEKTSAELYELFGVEVADVCGQVAEKLGFELKQAITMRNLTDWEAAYFVNGKAPVGKYSQWDGQVKAAIKAGFFVEGKAPSAEDVGDMPAAHVALLFKATDYIIIRAGQVDPNF